MQPYESVRIGKGSSSDGKRLMEPPTKSQNTVRRKRPHAVIRELLTSRPQGTAMLYPWAGFNDEWLGE